MVKDDDLTSLLNLIERSKGIKERIQKELSDIREKAVKLKNEVQYSEKARLIIQTVAQDTQSQLAVPVSNLITHALKAIFDNPYTFVVKFVLNRDRTECCLLVERDGKEYKDILFETGGGVADVISCFLRPSLLSIRQPKLRPVLILDEPFKNINDKTRVLHQRIADTLKNISAELGIQIIVVTMIPEFERVADKIFHIQNGIATEPAR